MTPARFWDLIEKNIDVSENFEVDPSRLERALIALPPEEIIEFNARFNEPYTESYSWALWGAAYLINGGCSDDGFDYFRGWLIAQGKRVFDAAVADPDSLVDHSEMDVECEDMLYVAARAYKAAIGGKEMPAIPYRYPELGQGWDFDDDDEMARRYPRLFTKYVGSQEGA